MKTIGILGGMGPRATVEFEKILLDKLPGSDQDLPIIITINDGGIPDRSKFILGIGEDPVSRMQYNIGQLESIGADIICVPCNTACMPQIFNRLRSSSQLICLPKIVRDKVVESGFSKICLLATRGTAESGFYQSLFETTNTECLTPDDSLQFRISHLIMTIKRGDIAEAKILTRLILPTLEKLGCQAIIMGCTELPMVASELASGKIIGINTLDILAETAAQICYSKNERINHAARPIYN